MPRGDQPTTKALALKDGWIYEDALPASITTEQYDWWFKESLVLDGVRMGPPLPTDNPTQQKLEPRRTVLPNSRAYDRAGTGDHSLFSNKHCCVCGKPCKGGTAWLLLTRALDGTQEFAISSPEDATEEERDTSMWIAPIGADCLGKHPSLAHAVIHFDSRASVVAPQGDAGISWTALLGVLERLRSKNRNPNNQWYDGWNAAIRCLINDINARFSSPASSPVPPEQEHAFLQFPLGHFRNPEYDNGRCWQVVSHAYCGLPADAEIHQSRATPAPVVEQEQKARYDSAHEARYVMTHAVHPDIVVLWFLALKSHWFDDPNNVFYGAREKAKAYLYKWVETGELADDHTTLEITTASKFREWLESSWTATSSPSLAAREAAEEIARRWVLGDMPEASKFHAFRQTQLCALAEEVLSKFFCSPVPGDESRDAWSKWFDRLGDKASADVVNATAELVTDERLAALVQAGVLPKADSVGEESK